MSTRNKSLILIKSSVIAMGIIMILLMVSLFIKINKKESNQTQVLTCKKHKTAIIGNVIDSDLNEKGQIVLLYKHKIIVLDKCLNIISQRKLIQKRRLITGYYKKSGK